MGLTYNWKITGLKKQNTDTIDGAIANVRWQLEGVDSDGYSGSFGGATPFDLKRIETGSFVPYEELTEEIVIGWVRNIASGSVEYPHYWEHINEMIENQITSSKYLVKEIGTTETPWYTGSTDTPDAPPV